MDPDDEQRNADETSNSKQPSQQELPYTLPQIKNVKAIKNPDNSSREIIVTWDQPKRSGDFHCRVYLKADRKTEEQIIKKSQTEACFENLKSDTSYTAYVGTVGKNKKTSELASSNPVLTDKAVQTPRFDIKTQGKPIIETCSYDFNDSHLESQFSWRLPDLGVEKNNFKLMGVQACIFERGSKFEEQVTVENNIKAKTKILECLKSYEFIVRSFYLNIDENQQLTATDTRFLDTGIGNPSILDVRCDGQNILVDWSAAKGATKYTLKLMNEKNQVIKKVELVMFPTEKLTKMIPLTHGQTIEFVIKATGGGEHQESRKKFLIGGNKSVTNVVAEKDQISRREIIVQWKQPATPPHGYKLSLYEVEKDGLKLFEEKNALEPTQVSHRFTELKSRTEYICKVIPIYDGEPKIGSFSNLEETDIRVESVPKTHNDFGKPEYVMNTEKGGHDDLIIMLSWSKINMGENYKIIGYHVNVSHSIREDVNFDDFNAKLPPTTTNVDVDNLKRGQKYDVKLTTEYIDLDDRSNMIKTTKTHSFCTIPSKPSITNCKLKNGEIIISWEFVHGAKHYRLVIKDEILSKNIADDEVLSGSESKVKIQTTETLCIGRTCMIKIITSVNNLNAESEWKAYLIGGKLVPRNVEASQNSDNPKRSIIVSFDAPKQRPVKEYKIEVVPEFGKRKTFCCSSNTVLVEYLRKGIEYKFHVFANHGDEWSDGSISNICRTDRDDNHNPSIGFDKTYGSKFDLQEANFTGYATTVNVNKGKDFGKVRDLSLAPVNEKQPNKKEILKLSWKVPSFDNDAFAYKAEKYKVEIKKINFSESRVIYIKFEKDIPEYCTENQELELGETYNISVSTIYIDIDQDEEYISNAAEKKVQTRTKTNVQKEASSTAKITTHVLPTGDVQFDEGQPCITEDDKVQQEKYDINDQRSSVIRPAVQRQTRLTKPPEELLQMPFNRTSQAKITTHVFPTAGVQFDEGQLCITEDDRVQQEKCDINDQRSSVIRPAVQQRTCLTKPTEEVLQMPCNRTSQGEKIFVYHSKSEDCGQARDLVHSLRQTANNDMLTVVWKPPSFDNHPSDYKVNQFELEIRKVSEPGSVHTILFSKDNTYQLSDITLDHGSTYEVLITTNYTDTAKNSDFISDANRLKIQTRPCQPEIIENDTHHDDQLKIRWTFCKGAKYYTIEIFDKDSDKRLVHEYTDQRCSKSYKFDKIINFGISYYAIVTAINADGQTNSAKTETKTIEKLTSTSRSTWLSGVLFWMISFPVAWITGLISNVTKLFIVNKRWTHIEGTGIWYDQTSRYRKGSKVFDAIRESGATNQDAVVKFVTVFNIEEKEIIEKLKREIIIHMNTYFHKNVVTYFQSDDCKYKGKDAFFILMEKCDKKTLSDRIKDKNLPYIERAKTVECIAQGSQHLKKNDILHRDLKPQNILYKGDDPKISDFGLSKKIPPNKSHTHQSLEFCGTAGWGAPETYSKNAKISFAADIYSAGLVFFFALTNGKHPYGDDPRSWHAYIKDDTDCNLEPLYDTPDGIVAYDLISLMLSRDPKDRPTIEEVLKHPFFWNVEKKNIFYDDIYSTIEYHSETKTKNESKIFGPHQKKYLEKVVTEKLNWKNKLLLTKAEEKYIKDNLKRRKSPNIKVQKDTMKVLAKKHADNSVTNMVCFIRHRFTHSGEDRREGKIDLTDEELWEFFNSNSNSNSNKRYPYLFIYTYYTVKKYYEAKTASDLDYLKKLAECF